MEKYISVNIGFKVVGIIQKFEIKLKVSYFIFNNVINNNIAINKIKFQLKFNKRSCYIYYVNYILNFLVKVLLFKNNVKLFKEQFNSAKVIIKLEYIIYNY